MAVLIAIYGIVGRWHPPAFLSWSVWLAPTLRFPGYDAVLILLLLGAIAVSRVACRLHRESHSATVIRAVNSPIDDLLIAGLSLLCVPIVRFAASYFGPSTFASQYLIPASLGLATEQRWKRSPLRTQRSSWRMRGGLLPLRHYQRRHDLTYVYPMDWAAANAASELSATTGYKMMAHWARVGYADSTMLSGARVPCTDTLFVVLNYRHNAWFDDRVRSDTALAVQRIGGPDPTEFGVMYLVRRRGTSMPVACRTRSPSVP